MSSNTKLLCALFYTWKQNKLFLVVSAVFFGTFKFSGQTLIYRGIMRKVWGNRLLFPRLKLKIPLVESTYQRKHPKWSCEIWWKLWISEEAIKNILYLRDFNIVNISLTFLSRIEFLASRLSLGCQTELKSRFIDIPKKKLWHSYFILQWT